MILLTGATGHLGANLLRRLLSDGRDVRVLLRAASDNTSIDGLAVDRVYGDISDLSACHKAVAGCTQIHHCAALVSTLSGGAKLERDLFASNVLGTRNLLRAALDAHVDKVVVTGSFSATGHVDGQPSDETVPFNPYSPALPYAHSKAAAEHECLKAHAQGLNVVVAVSCAIVGPHDYKPSRLGRLLLDIANGRSWMYVPGGFEFVAARDIVEGHILAMEKGRSGHKYIFNTQFLTVDELLGIYEQVTGRRRPPLRLPSWLASGLAGTINPVLAGLFPNMPRRFTPAAIRILRMRRHADNSKARTELGYEPSNITDAIREAYEFFQAQGKIARTGNSPLPERKPPRLRGGFPWLGHAMRFHKNPVAFMQRGYAELGDVFTFKMAGSQVTALIGPEGHQAFFRGDADKTLSVREAYQFMVPIFGKGVAYDVSRERMDEQLEFLIPALNEQRMRSYVGFIREEVDALSAKLGDEGEVQLPELTQELTLYIASRCLIGREFRQELSDEFNHLYHDLEGGIHLLAFFYPNLPLPSFRRRDRARARMVEIISGIIAKRRERGSQEEDFLQTLISARYADGSSLNEDQITGMLLTALFAGHHTTAVQTAWTGVELLRNPDYFARVLEEQSNLRGDSEGKGAGLTFDSFKKMPILERGMREAERLHPPLVVLMRTVVKDFVFRDYVLPPGSMVMISPGAGHRVPTVFSNPDQFDPDRFAPGREEDKRARHSIITFGGGKYACLGGSFAYLQVKAIWSMLLERYDWELLDKDVTADYGTFVVGPTLPCRVRYSRKKHAPADVPLVSASTPLGPG